MKIKAIFFDIDGTLISAHNRILSDDLINAFNTLRNKGVLLFIASGRAKLEIEELGIDKQYKFDGYLTLNGGYCYNDKEVIYNLPIDKQDVKNVLELLDEHDFSCLFIEEGQMYANKHTPLLIKAQDAIKTSLPLLSDVSRANDNDIYQMIPYLYEEDMDIFKEAITNCKYVKWHDNSWDVIPKDSGKEKAIEEMLKYYNLKQDEVMAFGDGHNDIEMLEYVGLGVSMGNAGDEVKEVSDYVTSSVDEDGIVAALKHFNMV